MFLETPRQFVEFRVLMCYMCRPNAPSCVRWVPSTLRWKIDGSRKQIRSMTLRQATIQLLTSELRVYRVGTLLRTSVRSSSSSLSQIGGLFQLSSIISLNSCCTHGAICINT